MTLSQVQALVAGGESETVEFKKSTANLSRAAETLCGMLNGAGGVVLFGVTDGGHIVGQQVSDTTLREVAATLRDFEPSALVEVERIPVESGREVLALVASPDSSQGPWVYRGRPWKRMGPTTSPMPQGDLVRHILVRGPGITLWETMPAIEHDIDDLDHQEILRTVRLGIEMGRLPEDTGTSIPDILDRFRLRENGRLVNAAAVLFSKSPFFHYPQCGIRLARFAGIDKDEFIDNRREHGHAFLLLEEAMNFFRRHFSIAGRFHADSIVREDIPEYPILAVREAVVNALIHRSYVDVGGAVSIALYSDRLEIWSDGVLPFGQRPEELKRQHTSRPRNPIIANVFFRRGLIEAWGRGTQKIVELCVKAGHPEPEFWMQGEHWTVVTFRPRPASVAVPATGLLPERPREILRILRAAGRPVSFGEIRAAMASPPSARTVRNDLFALRDVGLVTLVGTGRGARWVALDQGHGMGNE